MTVRERQVITARGLREVGITVLAFFMIIFGVLHSERIEPTALAVIFGCAVTLLGLPPAARIDEWLRRRPTDGSTPAITQSPSDGS